MNRVRLREEKKEDKGKEQKIFQVLTGQAFSKRRL